MSKRTNIGLSLAATALILNAEPQTYQRTATIMNGGSPGMGRCTVEVVVDGAAQAEISGLHATLRNLKGQPPQWRRFECTGAVPANPRNFRFSGVDGRGRQELVAAPANGEPAVIRIEDKDNGSEGYTFEITWNEGNYSRNDGYGQPYNGQLQPGYGDQRPGYLESPPVLPGHGHPGRMTSDEAVRLCQDYVRDEAGRRFSAGDVIFRRTLIDDEPGRNDFVNGFFEARGPYARSRNYSFSCSVNFNSGEVRSADIHLMNNGQTAFGDASSSRTIQACEASVEQRLRQDGYQRADFGSVSLGDGPGRNDSVRGSVTALERNQPVWFDFSCGVDLRRASVRSVNVDRRRT
jgi:hypothetical protein